MGSQPKTMPVPANSHAQTSGYSFFRVQAWVAQKNPRAACAELYICLYQTPAASLNGLETCFLS